MQIRTQKQKIQNADTLAVTVGLTQTRNLTINLSSYAGFTVAGFEFTLSFADQLGKLNHTPAKTLMRRNT